MSFIESRIFPNLRPVKGTCSTVSEHLQLFTGFQQENAYVTITTH